jgi:hypothetical protein
VVAVEDAQLVAGQQRGGRRAQRGQEGADLIGGVTEQGTADGGLGAAQLLVQGLGGDGDPLVPGGSAVGGVDGGAPAQDDVGEQVHRGGEEQLLGLLRLGVAFKQRVEFGRGEDVFQKGASQDAERGLPNEPLQHGREGVHRSSSQAAGEWGCAFLGSRAAADSKAPKPTPVTLRTITPL